MALADLLRPVAFTGDKWYGYELSGMSRMGIRYQDGRRVAVLAYSYVLFDGRTPHAERGKIREVCPITPAIERALDRAWVDGSYPYAEQAGHRLTAENTIADVRVAEVLRLAARGVDLATYEPQPCP